MGGPPDLKNWLPRYQYESPALNSESLLDDFGIDEVEREEKEENSVGFRGNGNKDGAFVHEKQISNGVVESGSSSGNEHENQYLSKVALLLVLFCFMGSISYGTQSKDFIVSRYNLWF